MKHGALISFCTGCVIALGMGWVVFPRAMYTTANQPFAFSHSAHTGDKGGMKCEDCHSLGVDGKFSGIPKLEQCAGCHAQPVKGSAAEKEFIANYVATGHEIPWQVSSRQPENVYFSHASHLKLAKLECTKCHGNHGKSATLEPFQRNRVSGYSKAIADRHMEMGDCEKCHRENGLKNSCLDCHK